MAFLAIPAATGAAEALMAALGATAVVGGAVVVSDEIRKRNQAASASKDKAVAQTASVPTERKACDKCPPDCGTLVARNWNMSDTSREYQAQVTGFAPGTEWSFSGTDFDGFKSAQCRLQEAKAKYDQFFDPNDELPKFFFNVTGKLKILRQAKSQSSIVLANPPSLLSWHFMQPISYAYFTKQFRMITPNIETVFQP